jgi:hypothetical protein
MDEGQKLHYRSERQNNSKRKRMKQIGNEVNKTKDGKW